MYGSFSPNRWWRTPYFIQERFVILTTLPLGILFQPYFAVQWKRRSGTALGNSSRIKICSQEKNIPPLIHFLILHCHLLLLYFPQLRTDHVTIHKISEEQWEWRKDMERCCLWCGCAIQYFVWILAHVTFIHRLIYQPASVLSFNFCSQHCTNFSLWSSQLHSFASYRRWWSTHLQFEGSMIWNL